MKKFIIALFAVAAFAACDSKNSNFEEVEGGFVYYGATYSTATFKGQEWMTSNLRYVPEGKTVSDDPTDGNGIWYPYEIVDGAAVALKDEASIAKYGYLYDYATILGVEEVTADNYATFEGAQGICPEGWHIPTRAEFISLCGSSNKADGEDTAPSDPESAFWDAEKNAGSLAVAQEKGFNFSPVGMVQVNNPTVTNKQYSSVIIDETKNIVDENWNGRPAVSYFMASTPYKVNESNGNIQFFGMMTTFSAANDFGKLSCGYSNFLSGYTLRCVKNK